MGWQNDRDKRFFKDNNVFAEAFNYLFYKEGLKMRIDPQDLKDITGYQYVDSYGNSVVIPRQRDRDVAKIWKDTLLILGLEIQRNINYAMPVRVMEYDTLTYRLQVDEIVEKNRGRNAGTTISTAKTGKLAIDISDDDFLSGFYKSNRLVPVVTAVLYAGEKEWDGFLNLHDLMNTSDPEILQLISDCKVHLIVPRYIDDKDFTHFKTELGFFLQCCKYQNEESFLYNLYKSDPNYSVSRNLAWTLKGMGFPINPGKKGGEVKLFSDMGRFYDAARVDGRAEGRVEGREEGREEGIDDATVGFIQARMKRGDTLEEALDVLCIPQDRHEKYKKLVQNAQNQQNQQNA